MTIEIGDYGTDVNNTGWKLNTGSGVRTYTQHINFTKHFASAPSVMVGLSDIDSQGDVRLSIGVNNVTTHGFDLVFVTWAGSTIYGAKANYIAVLE